MRRANRTVVGSISRSARDGECDSQPPVGATLPPDNEIVNSPSLPVVSLAVSSLAANRHGGCVIVANRDHSGAVVDGYLSSRVGANRA